MCLVFERGRAEEQDVPTQGCDGRDRSPARIAGVPRRAAQSLRFVYHEQIDARAHGLVGQLRALDEHLQRDHHTTMHVEWVERRTEIARHVGEALRVKEGEDPVVFPPEFTQPLHGQGIRRDHEAALDLPGMYEPIQDERRFDRLAESDLVGEQPPHRVRGARSLRNVELVGEQADASPEKGPQAVGFSKGQEVQDVHPRDEVFDVIEIARGEAIEECALALPAATAHAKARCRRSRAAASHPGVAPRSSVSSRVAVIRTGLPGLRSTRTSASVLAASRSVVPARKNSTTSARSSSAVTRPIPSSGLKRCVRWSPAVQERPDADTALGRPCVSRSLLFGSNRVLFVGRATTLLQRATASDDFIRTHSDTTPEPAHAHMIGPRQMAIGAEASAGSAWAGLTRRHQREVSRRHHVAAHIGR